MGIFEKFKLGFKKSANNLATGLREIIIKKEIDDNTLDKIEEFLISSDVGIDAASDIKDIIAQKKIDPKEDPISEVNKILKEYISAHPETSELADKLLKTSPEKDVKGQVSSEADQNSILQKLGNLITRK